MPSHSASASRRSSTNHRGSGNHVGEDSASSIGEASTSMLDDPKYAIASKFLSTMLQEVVIDAALLAQTQTSRQRKAEGKLPGGCPVCKTACQKPEQEEPPAIKTETEEGESTEAAAPKGLEMYQNNPLLTCLVCSRQVSANRYAQHLASCVGVGKGGIARRKGKHGANGSSSAKDRMRIKTALENRKKANFQTQSNRNTPTPMTRQDSPAGTSDDETAMRRSKSTSALNANGKRGLSPSNDSNKRAKISSSQPFAPSALGSSLPVTGSPLRKSKSASNLDADEDDEENDDEDDNDDAEDEADDDDDDDDAEDEEDEEEEEDDDDDDDDAEDEDDASIALGKARSTGDPRASSVADSYDDESEDAASDAVSDNPSIVPKRREAVSTKPIERSKGSDGEYIDVESASASQRRARRLLE